MRGVNLSALAVRERAITLFLIIALTLAGIYAFVSLGRAEDPPFTIKTLTVTAVWPGATAQEMQDLVADPLEKRLQELHWYDRVETFTRPGVVQMMLNLKDQTPPSEVPEQFYQARKKLGDEAHNLPLGALGPFVNDEYSDIEFAVYAVEAHNMPARLLVRQAESLRERLLHVAGVKKVTILGERPERIFVNFSYARLANLGVSARDVFAALQSQNAITPAGSIDTTGPQVFVRLAGALDDLQKIQDTPIVAGGRLLKLSDIAQVERGYEDPASFLIRHNGEPTLVLAVVMQDGWNGLELGRSLDAADKAMGAQLPAGVTLTKITDQAVNIRESVDEFMLKFFVALGVVMVVSLISLGWREGIVVAAAVPLTLATVLVIMLFTGRVFDRITLGALIVALGLLVDDAIIAIETMTVKMEEGFDRIAAASYAWSHTAAPMLAGTLVTIIGFMPVGFAKSTAGEYAGNIFWIVGYALITSWLVAVIFTPYLGVVLLPEFKKVDHAYEHIYATPRYNRFRRLVAWAVRHKFRVAGAVVGLFLLAGVGMLAVKQQFFPNTDRPELLAEVQMPEGTSIETTDAVAKNMETLRLRERIAQGLAPEAKLRVSQLVFGPYEHFPVAFRVMGPDYDVLRSIAAQVQTVMRANPHTRQVNQDSGERAATLHFALDQQRLQLIGLTPAEAAQQLQFLLTGVTVSQVREDIRTVDLVARSGGPERLDPARLGDLTLTNRIGAIIPVSQIGRIEFRSEDPILRRRDRIPTITVQSDIDEGSQPPQVSAEVEAALKPIVAALPAGYHIETGGNIEDSAKANVALARIFPIMLVLTLLVLVIQVRSFSAMFMVLLTAPLGLVGVVPILLIFHQPFGFTAILGLLGLSGILMRNTLILIGQIHTNRANGLDAYHAVVEATVQRARPVILTALAAVLAFISLTQSVFWSALAYTLIGGTAAGTALILLFLPALYSIWYRVKPTAANDAAAFAVPSDQNAETAAIDYGPRPA